MKTSIRLIYVSLLILAAAGLSSCSKDKGENGIGTAEFSLSLPADFSQLKSVSTDSVAVTYQLMISVTDLKGNPVLTDKLIPLYIFGTGFVSEKLEIKAGEFKLIKFMVINPSGVVVYAAPLAGSPLAYLTNKPLPLSFNIYPDRVTQILPEVLAVGDQSPDKFGYASFGVQIIKPLSFYTVCFLDNPLIMAPIQFTTAKLTVYANNGWHYSFKLEPVVNRIVIRGGSDIYKFILEKEGYVTQTFHFTASQLIATSKENPLVLKIPWGTPQYQILTLQPGPDGGKDAMISKLEPDKNFGTHKYFEATFLTEPILTVMRTNRSLIWFDLNQLPKSAIIQKVILKLSYDVPVPWDSTIIVPGTTSPNFIGGVLQQVTAPWEEGKVTWNNQ
ncbi:MAG: hypothetical protein C0408_08480, partial [Odoribacter sp.]|nr:hypothetical protein [Odoribacter sp.]